MFNVCSPPNIKYQTNNKRHQKQSISGTPLPKQYTFDCCIIYLQEMYLHTYPPFVYLFPLSKLSYTLCIVVWVQPRVMMWIVGMIPFSPDRRRQYCRRGDFEYSVMWCLSPSRWPRWHRFDGGTAIGMSTTRLIVVLY